MLKMKLKHKLIKLPPSPYILSKFLKKTSRSNGFGQFWTRHGKKHKLALFGLPAMVRHVLIEMILLTIFSSSVEPVLSSGHKPIRDFDERNRVVGMWGPMPKKLVHSKSKRPSLAIETGRSWH